MIMILLAPRFYNNDLKCKNTPLKCAILSLSNKFVSHSNFKEKIVNAKGVIRGEIFSRPMKTCLDNRLRVDIDVKMTTI